MKKKYIKYFALILIIFIIFPLTVFAAKGKTAESIKQLAELKSKNKVVNENTAKIKNVTKEIKNSEKLANIEVKKIKKNKETVNKDQFVEVKKQLTLIKQDTANSKKTIGNISILYNKFKNNKLNKNYEEALKNIDDIITIQQDRESSLEKISKDLTDLLIQLNNITKV